MKSDVNPVVSGMIAVQNENIIVSRDYSLSDNPQPISTLRYMIHCPKLWTDYLAQGMSNDVAQDASKVGLVDLLIKNNQPNKLNVIALANIEIDENHRKKGYARKVVDGIRHTTGEALEIHSILRNCVATWRKLGVELFHDGNGNPIKVSKHDGFIAGTIPPIEMTSENSKKQDVYEEMSL